MPERHDELRGKSYGTQWLHVVCRSLVHLLDFLRFAVDASQTLAASLAEE
jgi:hypothetical protein